MDLLKVKIYGRVQGVGFRYAAKREADKLGLTGFARNEDGGVVVIEAQGEEDALKKFLGWCHKGPWFAKVDKVEEEWSDNKKEFENFDIS